MVAPQALIEEFSLVAKALGLLADIAELERERTALLFSEAVLHNVEQRIADLDGQIRDRTIAYEASRQAIASPRTAGVPRVETPDATPRESRQAAR